MDMHTEPDTQDEPRYHYEPLPYWHCPMCGETGGIEILDDWYPVHGVIGVECGYCEYLEMD